MTQPSIVYILGAGFSKHAGLRLMSEINDEWATKGELSAHPDIKKYYGEAATDLGKVWSLILDDLAILNEGNSRTNAEKLICCIKDFLVWQFFKYEYEVNSGDSTELYKDFLKKCVQEKAQIITTNWDLLLERLALEHNVKLFDPILQNESKGDIKFLKLHGSFNWLPVESYRQILLRDPDLLQRDSDNTISIPEVLELKYRSFYEKYVNWGSVKPISDWIIGPYMQKDYTTSPFNELGNKAFDVLNTASEIFIIGYSFPEEDRFLGSLFRRALYQKTSYSETKITIINPYACDVERNLGKIMGIQANNFEIKKECRSFQDWMTQSKI